MKHLISRLKQINKVRAMILDSIAPEVNRRVLEALESDLSKKIVRYKA